MGYLYYLCFFTNNIYLSLVPHDMIYLCIKVGERILIILANLWNKFLFTIEKFINSQVNNLPIKGIFFYIFVDKHAIYIAKDMSHFIFIPLQNSSFSNSYAISLVFFLLLPTIATSSFHFPPVILLKLHFL